MAHTRTKQHGIHYTPPELADFLADSILQHADLPRGEITVLDPACGEGALLRAVSERLNKRVRKRLHLVGFETDTSALKAATIVLGNLDVADVTLQHQDFLDIDGMEATAGPPPRVLSERLPQADLVISNPPYVRTQVLGAKRAQQLAIRFGLTGRVDLYHPFAIGMSSVLKPGGTLGLLTSNRFLTVKSGETLRRLLRQSFCLRAIYDLGDTRLFDAAVLPVVVIGSKRINGTESQGECTFDRVYVNRTRVSRPVPQLPTVLEALRSREVEGVIEVAGEQFCVERGVLPDTECPSVWALSTGESQEWLQAVARKQATTFGDLSHVRVGVKTTADEVFIRDWDQLSQRLRPEPELLRPLATHHQACRWLRPDDEPYTRQLLYPHTVSAGRRVAVELADFPSARRYLLEHEARLRRRKYVLHAGRQWYEIWVPHHPDDWSKPKIVYPDISESPRFWLDRSGAVVNGDCYWITLRDAVEDDWLLVLLAVANSTLITKFYDTVFHNKLYAGRRRFMTQYVKQFPVPALQSKCAQQIVRRVKTALRSGMTTRRENELDSLVWESFGLDRGKLACAS